MKRSFKDFFRTNFIKALGFSGLIALTRPNPKVRYQVTPDPMRHLVTALLPSRTVDKIIARRLGLTPPA
jgi:hypothetical protein